MPGVDFDRREELAGVVSALLPELRDAVTDSWGDLLPGSVRWSTSARSQAISSVTVALEGLVEVITQGDLDDRTWARTREIVRGRGRLSHEEVEELMRTVRIVGLDLMLDRLQDLQGITVDERWMLAQEAQDYFEQLHRTREDVDPAMVDDLLAALERDGPDLG